MRENFWARVRSPWNLTCSLCKAWRFTDFQIPLFALETQGFCILLTDEAKGALCLDDDLKSLRATEDGLNGWTRDLGKLEGFVFVVSESDSELEIKSVYRPEEPSQPLMTLWPSEYPEILAPSLLLHLPRFPAVNRRILKLWADGWLNRVRKRPGISKKQTKSAMNLAEQFFILTQFCWLKFFWTRI